MRIRLVDFNSLGVHEPATPFGLLSIAAGVERLGHRVDIACIRTPSQIDRVCPTEERTGPPTTAPGAAPERFDLLGFTTRSDTLPLVLQVASRCKQVYGTPIVLGGPGATFVDRDILARFPFVDMIVRGEGDLTFPELVARLEAGQSLAPVQGVTFRNEAGDIVRTGERPLVKDLDSLPRLPYHLLQDPQTLAGEILVGRGCPNSCAFCSTRAFWGPGSRVHSPQRVIEDIALLHERYGYQFFRLYHDNLLAHRAFLEEFCALFRRKYAGLHFGLYGSINFISPEVVKLLSSSGCYSIFFGLETTSENMGAHIAKKHLPVAEMRQRLAWLREHGIKTRNSFILGWPDETNDDVNATLDFAIETQAVKPLHMPQDLQIHLLTIFPGTELYRNYSHRLRYTNDFSDLVEHTIQGTHPSITPMCREDARLFSAYATFRTDEEHREKHLWCKFFRLAAFIFPKTLYAAFRDCEMEPLQFFRTFASHALVRDIEWEKMTPGAVSLLGDTVESRLMDRFIPVVKAIYEGRGIACGYSLPLWNYEEPVAQVLCRRSGRINASYDSHASDTDFLAYVPVVPASTVLRSFDHDPESLFHEVYMQKQEGFDRHNSDMHFLYYVRRKHMDEIERTVYTVWPLKKPISRIIPPLFPLVNGERNCATVIEKLAGVLGINRLTPVFTDNIQRCLKILLDNGVLLLKGEAGGES